MAQSEEKDTTAAKMADVDDSGYDSHEIEERPLVFESDSYLKKLYDHATKRGITGQTTLVNLYRPVRPSYSNKAFVPPAWADLAHRSVAVPCILLLEDGQQFPPAESQPTCGYHLSLRFDKLLFAPALVLECQMYAGSPGTSELALEWHFNDHSSLPNGMREFELAAESVSFISRGVTCRGFGAMTAHEAKLSPQGVELLGVLRHLRDPDTVQSVTLLMEKHRMTESNRARLEDILAQIPGGSGPALPSFGAIEFEAWYKGAEFIMESDYWRRGCRTATIQSRLSGKNKDPMMPLECRDTFTSVAEAIVQLSQSVTVAEAESNKMLATWAAGHHNGAIYRTLKYTVLALDSRSLPGLGYGYNPPKDLECIITFKIGGKGVFKHRGRRLVDNPGLPFHTSFFRILDPKGIPQICINAPNDEDIEYFEVDLVPHQNSFTYNAQLDTLLQLGDYDNERWHPVLLNQYHEQLQDHDMTAASTISGELKRKADEWLLSCKPWNPEQKAAIEAITKAKGGLQIVVGAAGTGKTLLQKALSLYFWILGYHILNFSVDNKNVRSVAADLDTESLRREFPGFDFGDFEYLRLFSVQRELGADKMNDLQAESAVVGHENGNVLRLDEVQMALDGLEKIKGTPLEHGVVPTLIRLVDSGTKRTNHWQVLAEFIRSCRKKKLKDQRLTQSMKIRYKLAYEKCVAEIMGKTRFVLATAGNCRARELVEWWYPKGTDRRGVIVFIDEACRELEQNVWGGIVCEKWAKDVQGVWLFGDHMQFGPTNTSEQTQYLQFNVFRDRNDISLPSRLIREGYPHVLLKCQYRMHPDLSSFPGRKIYSGGLRDPASTRAVRLPGLLSTLTGIVAKHAMLSDAIRTRLLTQREAESGRVHWIEVHGSREQPLNSRSSFVKQHIEVFFSLILPDLMEFFSYRPQNMYDHVLIVTPYTATRDEYTRRINIRLKERPDLEEKNFPRVETVDASQGISSTFVFLDGAFQTDNQVGFMDEPARLNVAITRAMDAMWIIGGRMARGLGNRQFKGDSLVKQYRDELVAKGQCYQFRQVMPIAKDIPPKPKQEQQR